MIDKLRNWSRKIKSAYHKGSPAFSKTRENIRLEEPTYLNRYQGRDFLILGTGPSLKPFAPQLIDLIQERDLIVIGVNAAYELIDCDYVGFVNRGRLGQFGPGLKGRPGKLLLSIEFSDQFIQSITDQKHELIMWQSVKGETVSRVDDRGVIYHSGTSATLMILIAQVMGGRRIYAAGFDGWRNYLNGKGDSSFRATSYKPNKDEQERLRMVAYWNRVLTEALDSIQKNALERGLTRFSIITPTEFKAHFDGTVLGIENDPVTKGGSYY